MAGLFITGTGTGVGKTLVTAALIRHLVQSGRDAVALKPFVSGIDTDTRWQDNDPFVLSSAMNGRYCPELISQIRLKLPLSPYDAARYANSAFDLDSVIGATKALAERHETYLIEGVGGVEVPLTETETVGDFIRRLEIPALVVARTDLGTINHTLMTVNALRSRQIPVFGVVFLDHRPVDENSEADLDCIAGPDTATRFARVSNFGTIPYISELKAAPDIATYLSSLPLNSSPLNKIIDSLTQSF